MELHRRPNLLFRGRPVPNPIGRRDWRAATEALGRFQAMLHEALTDETWTLDVSDAQGRYTFRPSPSDLGSMTAVVQIEDCPGRGDYDRKRDAVLEAFERSGLARYLYFDGTDYGGGTADTCPDRGYHFYDPKKGRKPGVGSLGAGYAEAAACERDLVEANPEHEAIYASLMKWS